MVGQNPCRTSRDDRSFEGAGRIMLDLRRVISYNDIRLPSLIDCMLKKGARPG